MTPLRYQGRFPWRKQGTRQSKDDDTMKEREVVDLGDESLVDSDIEKEHPKEKSPSLLQAFKLLKRGKKRKMQGCVHFYNLM